MMTQANVDNKLSQMFLDAGPQRVIREMERLLTQANQKHQLQVADPAKAAEHFFCLIKGSDNIRLLIGCNPDLKSPAAVEAHIRDVVGLFLRAYRCP
jgi:TetR/AcrR family transcriptional repressor of mexJK operon